MRIFNLTKEFQVVCRSERTRYGFRHLATMLQNGVEIQDGKCTYQNRTWESYEFQSVLSNVVNKAHENKLISDSEKEVCDEFIKEGKEDNSHLKTISMVASLGEVFCDNQKDKNSWKARMLKAGLENKGLSMPEDWDDLDEDEKTKRLDGVIEIMGGSK